MAVIVMMAQGNNCIGYSETPAANRIEAINGLSGVLVLSANPNLMVKVTNASHDIKVEKGRAATGNMYEYVVVFDPNDFADVVKLRVSSRTLLYSTSFTVSRKKMKPDYLLAYTVEEVPEPIRCDDVHAANDVHTNAKEAKLEFTTKIKDLKVKCSPKLGANITTVKDKADADQSIITVIIPIDNLLSAKAAVDNNISELKAMEKKIDDMIATDDEIKRYESLSAEHEAAVANFSELQVVELFADSTNHLVVNIEDLQPRSYRRYIVVPYETVVERYVTECSAFVANGGKLFEQRKYPDARVAYVNALNSKDIKTEMRPTIMQNISDCDSCTLYAKRANYSVRQLMELRKQPSANQEEVARYASSACEFFEKLNEMNSNEYYDKMIARLNDIMKDMPLEIAFTLVEWLTLNEGNPIPNLEIWAYYGSDAVNIKMMQSAKKFRKTINSNSDNFRQVGVTDANGKSEVSLDRKSLPQGFFFCPTSDDTVKIAYIALNTLNREAQGTYLKKQFRMKLYKRTNKYF